MVSQAKGITRKFPSQERSRRTVETILEGAAHVLERHGYEGASTNLIAKVAGVSIGSLYQYFPDKEALVGALIEKIYSDDQQAIQKSLQRTRSRGFERTVIGLVRTLLKRFSEKKALRKVIFHEVPRTGPMRSINNVKACLAGVFKDFLLEHEEFTRERELDLKLFILVNSIEAALYAAVFEHGTRLNEKAFLRELKDLIIRYLRPGEEAPRLGAHSLRHR